MIWARSKNKHVNGAERSPMKARYTWHLQGPNGTAACHIGCPISDVVADRPPEGERVCMNCQNRANAAGQSTLENKDV